MSFPNVTLYNIVQSFTSPVAPLWAWLLSNTGCTRNLCATFIYPYRKCKFTFVERNIYLKSATYRVFSKMFNKFYINSYNKVCSSFCIFPPFFKDSVSIFSIPCLTPYSRWERYYMGKKKTFSLRGTTSEIQRNQGCWPWWPCDGTYSPNPILWNLIFKQQRASTSLCGRASSFWESEFLSSLTS